jgi:hypothetical protein
MTKFAIETADIVTTPESSNVGNTNKDNTHHLLHIKGIVNFKFIPHGKTINQTYYVEILKRLHGAVLTKKA